MSDVLYDYSSFSEERINSIFTGWDGLSGYHGLLIRRCAGLFLGETILDVGCGLCHLYEGLKLVTHRGFTQYVGIEKHPTILAMARERYPNLQIIEGDLYSLPIHEKFDTVYAIGLYREEPKRNDGLLQMLEHTNKCLIVTYFAIKKGRVPNTLYFEDASCEFIDHNIDERLEIVRIWKH